jgi:uncharacterized membrane protein
VVVRQEAYFSGPIPPPSVLAQYNDVLPNGADRIMTMAERQSQHREALEKRVVDGNVASQTRGSYFAFILLLITIVGGLYLLHEGKSVVGLSAIVASVGGAVGVFFYSKREQRKERVVKSDAIARPRNKS